MVSTENPPIFALTGSIGTGKSAVLKLFGQLGASTLSADDLAREAVAPGGRCLKEIAAQFGNGILNVDGTLERKKLAAIIFADPAKRAALEAILHPRIRELFLEKVALARAAGAKSIIYEIPLYFESGYSDPNIKAVIVVTAPEAVIVQRVMSRDKLQEPEVRARLNAQLPQDEKARRADYVVINDGSSEKLAQQVREIFAAISA